MLAGAQGRAAQRSMEILLALGKIYGADRLLPVASVQIAGVSYDNLGEAGLAFLQEMATDGRAVALATLNPAGLDVDDPAALGIDDAFAARQRQVLEAFARMGVVDTCTCTPYLAGNLPRFGEHLAWAESSAVCLANSVLGARTNREGGPSALAAALTGRTPRYGLHLADQRRPTVTVQVGARLAGCSDYGALGALVGSQLGNAIPLFTGCGPDVSLDQLKSLAAALATYGGTAMFHMRGVTPEAAAAPDPPPARTLTVQDHDLAQQRAALSDEGEVDFVSVGCPHASLHELRRVAAALRGRRVQVETWIHTARPVAQVARRAGLLREVEASGARVACDTCMVVAPLKGRFTTLATNSAKCAYYGRSKNGFGVRFATLEQCMALACDPRGGQP